MSPLLKKRWAVAAKKRNEKMGHTKIDFESGGLAGGDYPLAPVG